MINIIDRSKDGFDKLVSTDKWKLAVITHSKDYDELKVFKRHLSSDEAFILVKGKATIYTYEDDKLHICKMKKDKAYVVCQSTWHHVKVCKNAKLVVVENSDVTLDNTQSIKKEDLIL